VRINIWNEEHLTALYAQQIGRVRPGGAPGLKADADTLYRAMAAADKAIVFPLREVRPHLQRLAHWWHDSRSEDLGARERCEARSASLFPQSWLLDPGPSQAKTGAHPFASARPTEEASPDCEVSA
jgi:hypothetical protein